MYPKLEWTIAIHPKPQGNLRPKAEILIPQVENTLNIQPELSLFVIHKIECSDWGSYEGGKYSRIPRYDFPLPLWNESSRWSRDHSSRCCSTNFVLDLSFNFTNGLQRSFYLSWKPDECPDYSDYIAELTKLCQHIEAEYIRRCEEAQTSGETGLVIITADSVRMAAIVEEQRKGVRPTRRVRIAEAG